MLPSAKLRVLSYKVSDDTACPRGRSPPQVRRSPTGVLINTNYLNPNKKPIAQHHCGSKYRSVNPPASLWKFRSLGMNTICGRLPTDSQNPYFFLYLKLIKSLKMDPSRPLHAWGCEGLLRGMDTPANPGFSPWMRPSFSLRQKQGSPFQVMP